MLCHESIGNLPVFAEGAGGADLIEAHEPRVTRNVSGDYCRQPSSDPAWLDFGHGPDPLRDVSMYNRSVGCHRGVHGAPRENRCVCL